MEDIKGDSQALLLLLKSFSAKEYKKIKFQERKSSPLLTSEIEVNGEMLFQHPGYLLKLVYYPHQERFELKKGIVTIQRDDAEARTLSLKDYPELNAFVTAYTAVLDGDIERLRVFYSLVFDSREYGWRLSLHPRLEAMREHVVKIVFTGDATNIRSIQVFESGGDVSTTSFLE